MIVDHIESGRGPPSISPNFEEAPPASQTPPARAMKCPSCGFKEAFNGMGYTALDPEIENPHLQISVPTCGNCGYKYKHDKELWVIPPIYFDPNMRVFGGIILTIVEPDRRKPR